MKRLALLLLFAAPLFAQTPDGVIAAARSTTWSSAGVIGGIPSGTWTQCGTTISAGATLATVNAAIAACAVNHFVLMAAGSYSFAGTIEMKSGVELRGAGADQTIIAFTAGTGGCGAWGGYGVHVCFSDATGLYYGSTQVAPGGTNSASWTGGYSQNATSLTLANVGSSGIVNGQWIYLDQNNDTTITSTGLIVCDTTSPACSLEGGSPGRCSVGAGGSGCVSGGNIDRNQVQIVQVTAGCASICTGAGPFTVTISQGLRGINWRSGQSPGAWWSTAGTGIMQNAGIANLSLDYSADSSSAFGIVFTNAVNCWVNGIRSIKSSRNHVWFQAAAHITKQNSYFYSTQNAAEQSYGSESFISSDNLVVNNIYQQVTTPAMIGNAIGSAFLYNFALDDLTSIPTSFYFECIYSNHDAGVQYNLIEGNVCGGTEGDVFHGTSGLNTFLRNYFVGWESTKTTNTTSLQEYSYNRFVNVVGNVFGCNNSNASLYPGNCGGNYTSTYQTSLGPGTAATVYDLGAGNTEGSVTVAPDSYVAASMLRWGNYDVVTAAVRFCTNSTSPCTGSEVPSTLSDGYANPVPSSHTISSSYYYSSKPSWWPSTKPWPPIGPDVTGGNIPGVGGFAYTNPAADCALNVMHMPIDGSGSVLTFNANTCYGSPTPTPNPVTIIGATGVQVPASGTQQLSVQCQTNPCPQVSYSATAGSVSSTGLFTAPASAQTVTVSAQTAGQVTAATLPITVFASTVNVPIKSFSFTSKESFPVPASRNCTCNLNAAQTGYSCSCQ
jgi:hypothetical protein